MPPSLHHDDIRDSFPKEATPSVYKDRFAPKGATTPRIDGESKDRLAQKSASTPRVDGDNFTFWQLLEELARAHDREVQLAKAESSVPHLAQGHISTRCQLPEGQDLFLDGADTETSLIQNLMHIARGSPAPVKCPPDPFTPNILEPLRTTSTPSAVPGKVTIGKDSSKGNEQTTMPVVEEFSSPTNGRRPSLSTAERSVSVLRISSGSRRWNSNASFVRILNSEEFEFLIAVAIVMNGLIMFCECQYVGLDVGFDLQYPGRSVRAHVVWTGAETVFSACDWVFGVLFLLEMVVKLACFRIDYFFDCKSWRTDWKLPFPRWFWSLQGYNILDFLCVVAFLFDKVASSSFVNPQMFRLLRLFRLCRLVRLLRFLETLDHLYVMTTAISGLSKVLGWAIALLTIMLLACDLFLVQTLQVIYFRGITIIDLTDDQLKRHHQMYAYFGTCTRCMLSMFEITLGNWPPIARLLSEEVSEWFTVVCLLHKVTIGFSVIGVITGIILQETFKVAQTDDIIMLRAKKRAGNTLRQKMRVLFNTLDEEQDGKLTLSEFKSIGEAPEIKTWLASLDIETDDLNTLFSLVDENSDGYITLEELITRVPRIKGSARGIDVLAIMKKLSYDLEMCKTILQSAT